MFFVKDNGSRACRKSAGTAGQDHGKGDQIVGGGIQAEVAVMGMGDLPRKAQSEAGPGMVLLRD